VMPHLTELERLVDGEVIPAGSPAFRELRRPFNAVFDVVEPQAVVRCASGGDVAETIAFIRQRGLHYATRGGGHDFAGRSTTPGILIDVSPMRSVTIAGGVIRIGAGAALGEVYGAIIPHGVTIPGGSCPSVGVSGLTLGGGLGILGRTYGVTSDRLVGARIALADGRVVDCDEDHEADLFWALRGGGNGHFGVVTELVFDPVPTPAATASFRLEWPFADAPAVAAAWMEWSPAAPDRASASLLVTAASDPAEEPSVEVVGTMLGSRSDAASLLDSFTTRVRTDPSSTFLEEMSYADTMGWWAARAGERIEDPRAVPATRAIHLIRSEFFARSLPAEATASLIERLTEGRVERQSRELDLSPWGGAYNRVAADRTAFVHRDAAFWIKHAAAVDADASSEAVAVARNWVDASWNEVHPWSTGGVFPNFADPELDDWGHAYHGPNFERLCRIKARYDPDNVFRFRQSLPLG
jgi:FAD/FMN-containing dehydrogenase